MILHSILVALSFGAGPDPESAQEQEAALPKLTHQSNDSGVLIQEGDRKVLFYQRSPQSWEGKYTRAGYVHPLYDLEGGILTEDFPADHRHHRGVFWAWHQVWVGDESAGDPWAIRDFAWNVTSVDVEPASPETLRLIATVDWLSTKLRDENDQPRRVVQETTRITVHPATADARFIDFEIQLLALEPNIRLGGSEDEKGYGGFSVRVRLPDDIQFHDPAGLVEPKFGPASTAPWMSLAGSFTDACRGVTILAHPSLPKFPAPWILRSKHSMQNPVWPGREPVPLSLDQPLKLRYRIVVHREPAARETADAWQAEFAR